jgi:Xaa-Pro aminopeptidase
VNPRIKRLLAQFDHHAIDAFLVTSDVNVTYLTGCPSVESWLLLLPEQSFYVTDARYAQEIRQKLRNIKVILYQDSKSEAVARLLRAEKATSLGYDPQHLSVSVFRHLRKYCSDIRFRSWPEVVEEFRMYKDPQEISALRKAARFNLSAFVYLRQLLKPGVTEQQVLIRLEQYVREKGLLFSFSPIIASGPQTCFPHARVTTRKMRAQEQVLADIGIDFLGYKSDLTRMFFLGKIPPLLQEVTEIVRVAQQKAIAGIQPGVPASEIDQLARNYFKKNKLDKYFLHSLGHGVGLEVHEAPRISPKSTVILKKGMVFTVEPAVYLPNQFGVRIEDIVLVTANGCDVLSR